MAIYNASFKATAMTNNRGTLEAMPLDQLMSILKKHELLRWDGLLQSGVSNTQPTP